MIARNMIITDLADERIEKLGGKIVNMAPPSENHMIVTSNIQAMFYNYLVDKPCKSYTESLEIELSEKDRVKPDVSIVCDREKIKRGVLHGAPTLVVEVLSPSTKVRDRTYKKRLYEQYGVQEYWIVDIMHMTIEVYINKSDVIERGIKDEKHIFTLDNTYEAFVEEDLTYMSEERRKEIVTTFTPSMFKDLTINVARVFKDIDL